MEPAIYHRLQDCVAQTGSASECGRRRNDNQDSYLVDDEMQLCVVADGIGGHMGGNVASQIACEHIADLMEVALENIRRDPVVDRKSAICSALASSFRSADRRIICEQSLNLRQSQMGTTALAAFVDVSHSAGDSVPRQHQLYIGHVGDSRALLIRDGQAIQLTTVHTLATGLLEAGVITAEQALRHPGRNTLYMFLGGELHDGPQIESCPVYDSDRIVLMTDGITDVLQNQQIAKLLENIYDSEIAAACLVDEAISSGAGDDVTCVVISIRD